MLDVCDCVCLLLALFSRVNLLVQLSAVEESKVLDVFPALPGDELHSLLDFMFYIYLYIFYIFEVTGLSHKTITLYRWV